MDLELPEMNKRIDDLVNYYTKGNVSKFVDLLNEKLEKEEKISQQKFNRIFNIDSKTKKYPGVSTEVISAIKKRFDKVNSDWLLIGKGERLLNSEQDIAYKSNKNYHDPLEGKNTDEWNVIRILVHEIAEIKSVATNRPFVDCVNEVNHSVALALRRSISP